MRDGPKVRDDAGQLRLALPVCRPGRCTGCRSGQKVAKHSERRQNQQCAQKCISEPLRQGVSPNSRHKSGYYASAPPLQCGPLPFEPRHRIARPHPGPKNRRQCVNAPDRKRRREARMQGFAGFFETKADDARQENGAGRGNPIRALFC